MLGGVVTALNELTDVLLLREDGRRALALARGEYGGVEERWVAQDSRGKAEVASVHREGGWATLPVEEVRWRPRERVVCSVRARVSIGGQHG